MMNTEVLIQRRAIYTSGYNAGVAAAVDYQNTNLAPAMGRLTIAFADYISVITRIAEVARFGEFRPDYMVERLQPLGGELSKVARLLTFAFDNMPDDEQSTEGRERVIVETSTIQDLIDNAVKRGDKGASLRKFFPQDDTTPITDIIDLGGRPGGMSPELQYLAERARYIRHSKKPRLKWGDVGFILFKELKAASIAAPSKLTTEENKALEWLIPYMNQLADGTWYVTNKPDLGKELSNLVKRQEKFFHKKGVFDELRSEE